MIAFILKVTLCWLFFYGIYELFLKKKTFFNANRSYLLITLLAGIALPLLEFVPWKNESNVAHVIYPMLLEIDDLQAVVATQAEESFNWFNLLYIAYGIGLLMSLSRFCLGISKILKIYKNSEKTKQSGYTLVITEEVHLPFSFFKWVFFSKKMALNKEIDKILEHEIEHIKGRHSFDVLATELLKVVFWCSPMIYLYRNALKEVHEYLADNVVVKNSDKITYKKLLLNQTNNGLQMALTHQFFNSHLKNRLKMISQKRSGRPTLVMYALGIPVLLLLLFAFTYSYQGNNENFTTLSENEYTSDEDVKALAEFAALFTDTIPKGQKSTELFKVVEEMPRFPGCEDMEGSAREIEDCAKQKMLEHIYTNLKYPKADKDNGVEGMSVVQFVITSTGEVRDAKMIRSLSSTADAEVLRVTNAMNSLPAKWRPGMQRGEAVNVLYTLPVRFKLEDNDKAEEKETIDEAAIDKSEEVFKVVEEMPRFPGCEDMEGGVKAKGDCSRRMMLEYIYTNLKYPKEDKDNGVEGISIVQFIVDEAGNVKSPKVIRSLSTTADAEVLKIVRKMNTMESKWIPGKQRGKAVKVQYTLPVKFKLQDESEEKEVVEEKPTESVFRLKTGADEKSGSTLTLRSTIDDEAHKPLVYLDGVEVDQNIEEVDPNTIASISVLKGEKAIEKYGQKGEHGVIEITSKGEEVVHEEVENLLKGKVKVTPLYIIDGEEKSSEHGEELSPDKIATVNVLKGSAAEEKYGAKGLNGVVEITTKEGVKGSTPKIVEDIKVTGIGAKVQPLFVINGVVKESNPASFQIEPDDIKSMNVLKGEKAIEKYGEKGTNGVIEITTKKGAKIGSTSTGSDKNWGIISSKDSQASKSEANDKKNYVSISGKVEGEDGEPLIGASIVVKGSQSGTISDLNGDFEISVPKGAELYISYVGYTPELVKLGSKKNIRAKLSKSSSEAKDRNADILKLDLVNVYPNPARETVNISFKAAPIATIIQLVDIDGKLIKDMSEKNFDGSFEQTIDLSEFSTNLILLRVEQEGKIFTRKIIVE